MADQDQAIGSGGLQRGAMMALGAGGLHVVRKETVALSTELPGRHEDYSETAAREDKSWWR